MTPTSTPLPQISPSEADRIRTHARSILEGEGQDEHDPALVEAVAKAMAGHRWGQWPEDRARHWRPLAIIALSTIRKHQAGE